MNIQKWRKIGSDILDKISDVLQVVMGLAFFILIIVLVGIFIFGSMFEADESLMKETAKAREVLSNALFNSFNDGGRIDVRYDTSVHVYISKKNYMLIPYPDRDRVITDVGSVWCKSKHLKTWCLPKVVLRDIQTGEDLGSYRCILGSVSKK